MVAKAYADTSFWGSLYTTDAHSSRADALVKRFHPILFTAVGRHELRNAIRLCAFRRQIDHSQVDSALRTLAEDEAAGILIESPLIWPRVLINAETLGARHTAAQGHRGMDVLHVAIALSLGATEFLTFDARQRELAAQAGLSVPT